MLLPTVHGIQTLRVIPLTCGYAPVFERELFNTRKANLRVLFTENHLFAGKKTDVTFFMLRTCYVRIKFTIAKLIVVFTINLGKNLEHFTFMHDIFIVNKILTNSRCSCDCGRGTPQNCTILFIIEIIFR